MQFLFAALPEGCAEVKVETDARAVLLCGAGYLQAEAACVGAEGGDEAGHMHYLHSLLAENAVQIEVLHVQQAAYLTGTVVPNARAAGAVAAVGDVDLMAVSPGASLRYFRALEIHPAGAEIALYEGCEGVALHEGGEHLHRHAQVGCDAGYVGLGAGGVEMQHVAALHWLAAFGGYAQAHAGGHEERIFAILFKFHI